MKLWIIGLGIFFCLVKPGIAEAVELTELMINALADEDFAKREQAADALVDFAAIRLVGTVVKLAEAAKNHPDPEIRKRSDETIRKIYERYELGVGKADFGWRLGWFLDHDGKTLSSYPMILETDEGGPAHEAGLRPGNVIAAMDDVDLRGDDSRNQLVKNLAMQSPGVEIRFKIRYNILDYAFQLYNRDKEKTVSISPVPTKRQPDPTAFDKKTFLAWRTRVVTPN